MQYEKVYKQMVRREQYLYERDRSHGVFYFSSERDLYRLCPNLYDTEKAEHEDHYDRCMRNAMYLALNDLEQMNPKWHSMIITYYFGCNVTQADLGEKYGVSRQSISQTLGRAILLLRHRANHHLKRLLNE